jgi:hypothetical protein
VLTEWAPSAFGTGASLSGVVSRRKNGRPKKEKKEKKRQSQQSRWWYFFRILIRVVRVTARS